MAPAGFGRKVLLLLYLGALTCILCSTYPGGYDNRVPPHSGHHQDNGGPHGDAWLPVFVYDSDPKPEPPSQDRQGDHSGNLRSGQGHDQDHHHEAHHQTPPHHREGQGHDSKCSFQWHARANINPDAMTHCLLQKVVAMATAGNRSYTEGIRDIIRVVLTRNDFERRVQCTSACRNGLSTDDLLNKIVAILQPDTIRTPGTRFSFDTFLKFAEKLIKFVTRMEHYRKRLCAHHGDSDTLLQHMATDFDKIPLNATLILKYMQNHYHPSALPWPPESFLGYQLEAHANRLLCVDLNSLITEIHTDHHGHDDRIGNHANEVISLAMVGYMALGYNIYTDDRPCPIHFLQDIFHSYGDPDDTIHFREVEKLLRDLSSAGHGHHPSHSAHPKQTRSLSDKPREHPIGSFQSGPRDDECGPPGSFMRNPPQGASHEGLSFLNTEWTEHRPDTPKCFHTRDLGRVVREKLRPDQFLDVCPVLLQQILNGCTFQRPHHSTTTVQQSTGIPTQNSSFNTTALPEIKEAQWKKYLYGSLSVLVISLSALLGGVFMKVSSKAVKMYLMPFLLALAVGCLVADATLHLLPEVLVAEEEEDEESGETITLSAPLTKMCALLGSIYAFFILELVMTKCGGGHSHDTEPRTSTNHIQLLSIVEQDNEEDNWSLSIPVNAHTMNNLTAVRKPSASSSSTVEGGDPQLPNRVDNLQTLDKKNSNNSCKSGASHVTGTKNLAAMVMIGDGIHNVADGLAIGAAFALSFPKGLSTAVTVLCHEIPHELGDFAVLISTGITIQRAMLLNFVCSLTSFAGLYAGLSAGSQESATSWIFSVGAGMFLYVALTNLIPECKEMFRKTPTCGMFVVQNVGLLFGYAAMLLMALFEDKLSL